MAEAPPPLPPRNANAKDSSALTTCSYSPAGLSELIQHVLVDEKWHPHVLLTGQASPTATIQDDKENVAPKEEPTPTFICQTCHCSVTVNVELAESRCPTADYLTHHYHQVAEHSFQCCGCGTVVKVSIQPPVIELDLIQSLSTTRPLVQTYANIGQNAQQQPTMASTLLVLMTYVRGLLNGVQRSINTHNQNFQARMGLDDPSKRVMEAIGFELKDDHFIAPDADDPVSNRNRLERIYMELLATLYDIRQTSGNNPSFTEAVSRVKPGLSSLRSILDTNDQEEAPTDSNKDVSVYEALGTRPGASDQLVIWIYHKLQEENPENASLYLDALVEISNSKNSETLLTEVAMERSKGLIGVKELKDAYLHFGVSDPEHADDHLLIGLFEVKVTDEPAEKATHVSKLQIIAESRHSQGLLRFLQTGEKPLAPLMPTATALNDGNPVGLNNIGNTCYLNSLLQYYFTLLPFRETVLYMDEHVEHEDSPDWSPKKIGGITVDQAEVRRAKKFVSLLRDLFNNLVNTSQRAISPAYELAYMALLNEKEDEEAAEEKQKAEGSPDAQVPESSNTTIEEDQDSKSNTPSYIDEKGASAPSSDTDGLNTEPLDERITITDENSIPTDEPPAYEDVIKDPSLIDEKKPLPPDPPKTAAKNKPNVANMMFGKQQDVTECMGNVMYLVEAALKPVELKDGEQTRDMVRDLFYGKARQILTYEDTQTLQSVRKVQEEDFAYVIIDASEDKDLYDGLDEYFFAGQVENFHGGRKATREVTVKRFPPVLQIQVQRVQFDRTTANVYKSNAYIPFDKVIYLDRYCEENFEMLASRRTQVADWRKEMEENDRVIADLTKNKAYPMPVPDMLKAAAEILKQHRQGDHGLDPAMYEEVLEILKQESKLATEAIQVKTQRNKELKDGIRKQYEELKDYAYRLHAVFIHQGQANYGHYWIYIYDNSGDQWWKYNDSRVSKVNESEIFQNTTGSTANPYFLVYVKADDADSLVETIVKPPINPAA